MRVVWLTSHHPAPREGAAAVLEFELVRAMAARHRIHVICGERPSGRIPELEALVDGVEYVKTEPRPSPRNRIERYWRLLTEDARTSFFDYGDTVEAFGDVLRRYEATNPVDLVQVVMSEVAPVLEYAHAPTALLLFDVLTRQARRELARPAEIRLRLLRLLRLWKISAWERRWYGRADGVACVSSVDAAFLSRVLKRTVDVIPNPISDAFFAVPNVPRSDAQVTLVATLDYRPNIEAIRWLTRAIWPEVLVQCPEAILRIVGWNPTAEVRACVESVGAELHANVPDVRPFYWEASVAVAPIHLGSGIRNKVLHAMACGAPVVATPIALEGLGFADGKHLLVRDGAVEFARGIVDVLNNPKAARARAHHARETVRAYRSDAVKETFEQWWMRAASSTE